MRAKREHVPQNDADYISSSPAAAYDNTRNQRNINARMNEREKLIGQHNDNEEMYMHGVGANPSNDASE